MIPSRTDTIEAAPSGRADGDRRQAYVETARRMFFQHGYGATSMSAIAAAVGGSKTTLWALFPSKQALFEAVVDDLVEHYGRALAVDLDGAGSLRAALAAMGHAVIDTILSEPVTQMHRMVTGEAGRFPELARVMYEKGAARGKARLAAYFAGRQAAGEMKPGDAVRAAEQFTGLCRAGIVEKRVLSLIAPPDAATVTAEVAAAVETFLAAWGGPTAASR